MIDIDQINTETLTEDILAIIDKLKVLVEKSELEENMSILEKNILTQNRNFLIALQTIVLYNCKEEEGKEE